ncbi:hypothetical protein [Paenibacillus sp. CCS19]|uniref:hypothetical protein n=1 Tax=Paenibacillus sp. CCS19 TaxID=3158387 RepID=UPI00295EC0C7|nr:hypothetical protein [Paenibacillus cellulosilyticus]
MEYHDRYGSVCYDRVMACSIGDARWKVQSRYPDVTIRAVTMNPIQDTQGNNPNEQPTV